MIAIYTGKTGSGKTKTMVNHAFERWLRGRDVYSNTTLYFKQNIPYLWRIYYKFTKKSAGKVIYFENIDDIVEVRSGLILFDEAQNLFHARSWDSLPEEFTDKLTQHRKDNLDMFATTQNLGQVVIDYRRLIQRWVQCKTVLQLGRSPRNIISLHIQIEKDVDYIYNATDDNKVPELKRNYFLIGLWSRRLYNTMFKVKFTKYKTIWRKIFLQNKTHSQWLILPRSMSQAEGLKVILSMKSIANPKT